MMRYVSITLLMLGYSLIVSAQNFDNSIPRSAVKWSPFHLMNFYPTVQVAYEHALSNMFTLQIDGGYVLSYKDDDRNYRDKRGFKSKLELRYYFDAGTKEGRTSYFALEPYYYRIKFDRTGEGEPECLDPTCQSVFVRIFRYELLYQEHGASFKLGKVYYLHDGFIADLNVGLTYRAIDYDSSMPDQFPPNSPSWFIGPEEKDREVVQPHLGIRIGYRFR